MSARKDRRYEVQVLAPLAGGEPRWHAVMRFVTGGAGSAYIPEQFADLGTAEQRARRLNILRRFAYRVVDRVTDRVEQEFAALPPTRGGLRA